MASRTLFVAPAVRGAASRRLAFNGRTAATEGGT
jgi:hypothetical protein